ncbi:MAG: SGNH/GDSL hydrolase family protein [Candidatus Eremiobacterota bacterium]
MTRLLASLAILLLLGCTPAVAPAPTPAAQAPTPVAAPAPERDYLLVGIGDSVTRGFGSSPGNSYFEQLEAELKPRLPGLGSLNVSVNGSTSPQHLERQVPAIPTQTPEVYGLVVVTTGGNDLIKNYGRTPPRPDAMYGATLKQARPWLDTFQPRLNRMLDAVEERFPGGCSIFLANIYDPTDGVGDIQNAGLGLPPWPDGLEFLKVYNQAIREVADERDEVELVDLHSTFMGHGIHHRDDYWYYDNLEDPNDAGYAAITKLFMAEMERTVLAAAGGPSKAGRQ